MKQNLFGFEFQPTRTLASHLPQVRSCLLDMIHTVRDNVEYYICHTAGYYQYLKLELRDNSKGLIEIQNETNEQKLQFSENNEGFRAHSEMTVVIQCCDAIDIGEAILDIH